MIAIVTGEPIEEHNYKTQLASKNQNLGAIVSFTGHVRGNETDILELEHYQGMTENMLAKIAYEAIDKFVLIDAVIVHRVGKMKSGEMIVLVMAASSHRQAAFDGASFMMDYLKTRAPFWKKETNGQWVDARTEDEDAFARWL